jgi:substrate import-associated zinc metallohydrolase lipoprotein
MKKNIQYSIYLALIALSILGLQACKETTPDLSAKVEGLGGEVITNPTPLDKWLTDNFVKPYNIEVLYRWQPYEVPLAKTLVPPLVDQVRPAMEAVKQIWIDPYVKVAGADFVKKYCPKQYVLVGSANWNNDGTITLGTAEGGRKVVLYQINYVDKTNTAAIKEQMHTIHHEFAHILHQNILYPLDYKRITPGSYTSNWYNVSDAQALSLGYVTPYSMSNPDEDFVEVIATMLVEGKAGFDALVAQAPAAAQPLIRRKEQIVVDYFAKTYKINLRELQRLTTEAIATYTK